MTDKLALLSLERAAADMRRGVPVIVTDQQDIDQGGSGLLVLPLELANTENVKVFDELTAQYGVDESSILLTNQRALGLKVAGKGWPVVGIERSRWLMPADMVAIADPTLDLATPLKGPFVREETPADDMRLAAIKLVKWAQLLPAALICSLKNIQSLDHLLHMDAHTLLNADMLQAAALKQVASAKVPLAGAEKCRLVAFRPLSGGIEHVAIIVGEPAPSAPVLVRIHSECFTGDLLGSLKCDCGEQLRGAIHHMAEAGGGIVLYLAQEGRGIGLISKLKAYSLQDQGFDTVDANTRLGFEVDERVFAPAAVMLNSLGFAQVRLMTNNPEKVKGLSALGVQVVERVEHKFPPNPHNINYLNTKKARTGHLL